MKKTDILEGNAKKWYQFIRNEDISATTDLTFISDTISHRRNALFGHVARLPEDVPAHKALNCHITCRSVDHQAVSGDVVQIAPIADVLTSSGQINNLPPADLWSRAVICGHRQATLQPLPAK